MSMPRWPMRRTAAWRSVSRASNLAASSLAHASAASEARIEIRGDQDVRETSSHDKTSGDPRFKGNARSVISRSALVLLNAPQAPRNVSLECGIFRGSLPSANSRARHVGVDDRLLVASAYDGFGASSCAFRRYAVGEQRNFHDAISLPAEQVVGVLNIVQSEGMGYEWRQIHTTARDHRHESAHALLSARA